MRTGPSTSDAFLYVFSCDLSANLQIKICNFEGSYRDPADPTRKLGQLFAEATVYCNGKAAGFPVCTSFKPPPEEQYKKRNKVIQVWQEWLSLPVQISDLSRDAFVHFCIWELDLEYATPAIPQNSLSSVLDGNTQLSFPKRLVAQSSMSLFSKRGVLKSNAIDLQLSLASKPDPFHRCSQPWKFGQDGADDHLDVLFKQISRQQRNLIDCVPWLDPFTAKAIEDLRDKRKHSARNVYLLLEMPSIRYGPDHYDVVYFEEDPNDLQLSSTTMLAGKSAADPELGMDNLCENMHTIMTRNARAGTADKKLKPNKQAKDKLEAIIKLPSSQALSREQRDIVWKFRYYLSADRRALNKFLHSVNWDKPAEVTQALGLINDWSPIEAEDALELLSPSFKHPAVREYAVSRLYESATPDQVHLYLPQLVQALKYEPPATTDAALVTQADAAVISTENEDVVEMMDDLDIQRSSDDLASFLIKYSTTYSKIANFLFWHLKVEEEATRTTDEAMSQMYKWLREKLLDALNKHSIETRKHAVSLGAQMQFVEDLKAITKEAKEKSNRRDIRESSLRTKLAKDTRMRDLREMILPLDPTVKLDKVVPDAAQLFSSAMMPAKLTFKTVITEPGDLSEYTLIFKQGDDLRQDQLVIQMIRLMDSLFKKDNLDLKLTPYAVLATGVEEGFVQFIKARPLRDIIKKYNVHKDNSIKEAMKELRPDTKGPYGIEADVIDNYKKSLAGYCVMCYVLGVGDRHLDNLLLCENGRLFHVDFGFILGRDPKPMPPAMKLTSEMIQPLGGHDSKEFKEFCGFADSAYRILRRHANVLLNLFSLMLDAGIPDIAVEKDKAVFKVEQRLKLELSDEEAFKYIITLIYSSLNAKIPIISDMLHDWRQNLAW